MDLPLVVDCGTCEVRGIACGDCVMTVLLGAPSEFELRDRGGRTEFSEDEAQAMAALSATGLVPPLRLVRPISPDPGVAEAI